MRTSRASVSASTRSFFKVLSAMSRHPLGVSHDDLVAEPREDPLHPRRQPRRLDADPHRHSTPEPPPQARFGRRNPSTCSLTSPASSTTQTSLDFRCRSMPQLSTVGLPSSLGLEPVRFDLASSTLRRKSGDRPTHTIRYRFKPTDPSQRILVVNVREKLVVVRGGRVFAPAGACSSTEAVPNPYSTVDALDVAIRANAHLHDVPKR